MLRKLFLYTQRPLRRNLSVDTIDPKEVNYFKGFTSEWWSETGPMIALHTMNKLRIPFVREGILDTIEFPNENKESSLPLQGLSILDVGCGGTAQTLK